MPEDHIITHGSLVGTFRGFPQNWREGVYSGGVEGNRATGVGVIAFEYYGHYSGEIVDGLPDGRGSFFAMNIEEPFEGEWKNGVPLMTRIEVNLGTDGWFELGYGQGILQFYEDDTFPKNLSDQQLEDAIPWFQRAWQLGLEEVRFHVVAQMGEKMKATDEGRLKEFIGKVFARISPH
jgi:hypothetical protein